MLSERTSSPAQIKPPPKDDDYVDERVFIDAQNATPPWASSTALTSWFFRLVRPGRH